MRSFIFYSVLFIFSVCSLFADKPNILWISVEDMSPVLGCYGDEFAKTPNIDALANRSNQFMNAFATAPVCAPSRSCLINGLPASSQGTHHMRSFQEIPKYMTGFPALLRKAGYYTSNNVKTDYNSALWKRIIKESWDESSATAHWKNRPKDKPFFSVINLMTTHQSRSMVWSYKEFQESIQSQLKSNEITQASAAPIPPYYPNTDVVRKTQARFYDCVNLMDKQVGEILSQLKKDGLSEDTIIFYFSDHGSGMPRHKRALLDSGMKVPLLIHIPDKFKQKFNLPSKTDSLVNFADFAPTVLSMAGVDTPEYMEGESIFGRGPLDRKAVFGHRDRVDEVRDMARSVRTKDFLYIRNFMPHLGYNQTTGWPDSEEIRHEFYALLNFLYIRNFMPHLGYNQTTGWPDSEEIRHEFYALLNSPENSPSLRHFLSPTREVEELYDCSNDTMNLKNLAGEKGYEPVLVEMRKMLKREMQVKKDLGIFPEADMVRIASGEPLYDAIRHKDLNYKSILKQAFAVGQSQEGEFLKALSSQDDSVRYWALTGLRALGELTLSTKHKIEILLKDSFASVRLEAAAILYNMPQPSHKTV